jgi:single-stranded-DNA-specific exonuclease
VERGPAELLSGELSCSPLLARLLLRRGISDPEVARSFLRPKLLDLHDPFLLPGMEAATKRILRAIRDRQRITIFGDYDADGVSSTALLSSFFRFIECPVSCRLPNRLVDGYGLSAAVVEELASDGVELIITVDNGSSACEAVSAANRLGVDVVITDHHQPPDELPEASALVNPWLPGSTYPFQDLAGVGVTFKLVWALAQRFSRQTKLSPEFKTFLLDSLALVAVGTISDVVPLLGENRALAKFGLSALERSQQAGLRHLAKAALQGRSEPLLAHHVAFRIGPRLNAAGRLGTPDTALRLLVTDSDEEAAEILAELDRENSKRREIERTIFEAAAEQVRAQVDLANTRAIVLGAPDWHSGVIGIVASRLVEAFYRPTLLFAMEDEECKGSARSIPGVDLTAALATCHEHLIGYGGHEMAAGCRMAPYKLEAVRAQLNAAIPIAPEDMVPLVEADDRISLEELTEATLEELALLGPYGQSNPVPTFALEDAEVVGRPRTMGASGGHLAFHVRQDQAVRRAVAFGKGEFLPAVAQRGARVSLLLEAQLSRWQGNVEVELNVQDLRVL